MMPDEIARCNQCIDMILWQWGHGGQNNTQAIKELTVLIRKNLGLSASDPTNVGPLLARIDKLADKLMVSSSPFIIGLESANSVIEERVAELQENAGYRSVVFHKKLARDLPGIAVNRDWFRRLLDIVIDNALEAMQGSSRKNLSLATARVDGKVRISIQDTGRGIPVEVLSELFRKPHVDGNLGRGRGAYVAQLIANLYGGSIEVAGTNSKGSTIVIWMPIP